MTTTTDHDVVFAVGVPCAFSAQPFTWASSTGFTTLAVEPNSASVAPGIATTLATTSPGTYEDMWTITYSGNDRPSVGVIAAYR